MNLALCRGEPCSHLVQRSLRAAFAMAPDTQWGDNSWYSLGGAGRGAEVCLGEVWEDLSRWGYS